MAPILKTVTPPVFDLPGEQPQVPAETFAARADAAFARAGKDWLIVYADREHFGNIAFLSGFEPRFEEAFLLLGRGGRRVLITGNESESYAPLARLPGVEVLLAQSLSLPGQDRSQHPRLADRLRDAGLKAGDSVALAGWKYLEAQEEDEPAHAFFVPAAYVQMVERVVGRSGSLSDATAVLMHPETGLRTQVDVDQIAAWEWSATRCSLALWQIVSGVREGDTEYDAVARMRYTGEPINVHTMFASAAPGEPVIGLRSPTARRLRRGDGVTTALGFWGALSSRAGLLDTENDAFQAKASGYFEALCTWYAAADIGIAGGDLYAAVVETLARAGLRSALNPGHLTGHEEWMHTPVRPGSSDRIRSGMPFQVDVIPVPMSAGQALNCEDPVTFADEALRAELVARHPDCAARIEKRRTFMRDVLGVEVKPSILPLSATPLMLPPFWLTPERVFARD
ncbi:Xaa-Pro aminopeptidase [Mesorhizobium sp. BAC0120]|uniref:Xaa-Pro aminopeptidase n=1 Tax=Mesorhizobium sp. BAC0120 TaxID=3090670 RepID=UPI00298D3E69|nr:Xaa-Pro aminopeptidase [Mesorhizobium sp. BAC0120]MDW6022450.1 Xaa-Pro aminopeptidase [Mesorhizobium sp. BAC0120]